MGEEEKQLRGGKFQTFPRFQYGKFGCKILHPIREGIQELETVCKIKELVRVWGQSISAAARVKLQLL